MTITVVEYEAIQTGRVKQSAVAILKQDSPLGYRKVEVVLSILSNVDDLIANATQQQLGNYYGTGKVLTISEGAQIELKLSAKIVDTLLTIALPFELSYQSQVAGGSVTIDGLYSAWRVIYDGLVNADKVAIQRLTRAFTPSIFPYDEPVNPANVTEDYKREFNNNILRFLNTAFSRLGIL